MSSTVRCVPYGMHAAVGIKGMDVPGGYLATWKAAPMGGSSSDLVQRDW